jgi:CHAD domain-containing protein
MKARKVKLDPEASFEQGLRKTLAVRISELDSFADAAQDPAEVEALHDMRIAAKRVRYVLEVSEPVLPGAKGGVTAAKKLQDVLGEIHDCDELLPVIKKHVARLRDEDTAAAIAGDALPNRRKYRGLEALRAHTLARRARMHREFVARWPKLRKVIDPARVVKA